MNTHQTRDEETPEHNCTVESTELRTIQNELSHNVTDELPLSTMIIYISYHRNTVPVIVSSSTRE